MVSGESVSGVLILRQEHHDRGDTGAKMLSTWRPGEWCQRRRGQESDRVPKVTVPWPIGHIRKGFTYPLGSSQVDVIKFNHNSSVPLFSSFLMSCPWKNPTLTIWILFLVKSIWVNIH